MRTYHHDQQDGAQRRLALETYIEANLVTASKQFVCSSCTAICIPSTAGKEFIAGEMPHFGDYFSLRTDHGAPVRVVVMGQERGVPRERDERVGARGASAVTVAERTKYVEGFRPRGVRKPNSHINGTVFGLAAVFGNTGDEEYIIVDGQRVHVLDAFVLTNSTLCSAVDKSTGRAKASPQMKDACVRHARATLEILDPTVLIVQGGAARAAVEAALGCTLRNEQPIALRPDGAATAILLPHPTSQGATNWSGSGRTYFSRTVVPLLRQLIS